MIRGEGKTDALKAVIATAVTMALYSVLSRLLFHQIQNTYLQDCVKQAVFAVLVFAAVLLLRKTRIYRPNRKMLREGWGAAGFLLFVLLVNLIRCIYMKIEIGAVSFLFFALQMFLIGYCEETLFRGLILNGFHKLFGEGTLSGARLAVVCSGILFGAMHLINVTNPEISLSGAAVQAGAAAFLGMYLGAVYIRVGKGLWYLVGLHAVNDALAFIANGRMGGASAAAVIEQAGQQYGYVQIIVAALVYGLLTMFLLRKKKLMPCLQKMSAD